MEKAILKKLPTLYVYIHVILRKKTNSQNIKKKRDTAPHANNNTQVKIVKKPFFRSRLSLVV